MWLCRSHRRYAPSGDQAKAWILVVVAWNRCSHSRVSELTRYKPIRVSCDGNSFSVGAPGNSSESVWTTLSERQRTPLDMISFDVPNPQSLGVVAGQTIIFWAPNSQNAKAEQFVCRMHLQAVRIPKPLPFRCTLKLSKRHRSSS